MPAIGAPSFYGRGESPQKFVLGAELRLHVTSLVACKRPSTQVLQMAVGDRKLLERDGLTTVLRVP